MRRFVPSRCLVVATLTIVASAARAAEPAAPVNAPPGAPPAAGCCTLSVAFSREILDTLPLRRSTSGLYALAPTVAENGHAGKNGGGSRMDNNLRLDGLELTNPHFGDIAADPTALTTSGVRFTAAGLDAATGSTAGLLVAVERPSLFARWRATARYESAPSGLAAESRSGARSVTDEATPSAGLAGPLLRDRAWVYVYARAPRGSLGDRRNAFGGLPELRRHTDEWLAALRFAPSERQSVRLWSNGIDTKLRNDGIASQASPSVGVDSTTDRRLAAVEWTWQIDAAAGVRGFAGTTHEDNGQRALTELGYRPAFDPAHPERMGQFTTTADRLVAGATAPGQAVGGAALARNEQDFRRDQARLDYDRGIGADHALRFGLEGERSEERLDRRANGWGTVTWNASTGTFTALYVPVQPPHTGRSSTRAWFAQDEMRFGRLTVVAGLRGQRDDYYGEVFAEAGAGKRKARILTFDDGQELQPRLALALLLDPVRGDRLTLTAGRYTNTENKSLVRAASPTRLYSSRATFDAAGSMLSDVPSAGTQSKTIDAGLDPMHTDELALGYERPLADGWRTSAGAIWRRVGGIFDDVSADGLGNGPFHVAQLRGAERRYRAVTLGLVRPVDGRFAGLFVDATYTWSRLSGNWDIDFGSDSPFYNSSFLGDGPGVLLSDDRSGLLRGDRTHLAKLFASVRPWPHAVVGGALRFQSGGAWEARGLPSPNVSSSSYIRYLEPAGSRRMPSWTSLDLLVAYEIPLPGTSLTLEARCFNVFDAQPALEVDDRLILGRGTTPDNPNFGRPTVTAPARAVLLSALLRF